VNKIFENGRVLAESLEGVEENHSKEDTLNSNGESSQPCRSPCSTSNHSVYTLSSDRTHALTPSWKFRITVLIYGGTPRQTRTCHRRVRSTVSSMKQRESGRLSFRPHSCSLCTTNIISGVARPEQNPPYSSGSNSWVSQ